MAKQCICNRCGKSFDMWDEQEAFRIYHKCGYGTAYDGSMIELDLCCKCMEDIIGECKINPVRGVDESMQYQAN